MGKRKTLCKTGRTLSKSRKASSRKRGRTLVRKYCP